MPSLSHSPSLTDSSFGDRMIQMSTFINTTSPPSQFFLFGISNKARPQTLDIPAVPYTYMAQPQAMLNVDLATSGLLFPSYVLYGIDTTARPGLMPCDTKLESVKAKYKLKVFKTLTGGVGVPFI
ncbi:hypothetical protein PILCRDRAFT_6323 [Piloderma croceum F 1598]|uniref:Uncharacterized protein n=1 Tax=Piloderma croceum (strain F 1598) TaxID=765440 RepID=A0A0C3G285_PILCF|nr:hypothetical protein PILCRDRAFT_6323 [Piloderma croceum F 1598]